MFSWHISSASLHVPNSSGYPGATTEKGHTRDAPHPVTTAFPGQVHVRKSFEMNQLPLHRTFIRNPEQDLPLHRTQSTNTFVSKIVASQGHLFFSLRYLKPQSEDFTSEISAHTLYPITKFLLFSNDSYLLKWPINPLPYLTECYHLIPGPLLSTILTMFLLVQIITKALIIQILQIRNWWSWVTCIRSGPPIFGVLEVSTF